MKQLLITISVFMLMGCISFDKAITTHQAVFDGNIAAISDYLASGAEVEAKDNKFVGTFLHWASAGGKRK